MCLVHWECIVGLLAFFNGTKRNIGQGQNLYNFELVFILRHYTPQIINSYTIQILDTLIRLPDFLYRHVVDLARLGFMEIRQTNRK